MHASEQRAHGEEKGLAEVIGVFECLGVFPAEMIFPNDPLPGDSRFEETHVQPLNMAGKQCYLPLASEPPHLGRLNINAGQIKHIFDTFAQRNMGTHHHLVLLSGLGTQR